jgi:hypothetical protein
MDTEMRQLLEVSSADVDSGSEDMLVESGSSDQVIVEVSTRKRVATGAGILVLVALLAFAFVKGGAAPAQAANMDAKGAISKFSVGSSSINSPQQLFESDEFARRLSETTLRSVNQHQPLAQSGPMKARLEAGFKAEFKNGLQQFAQSMPGQAPFLQKQLPPGAQEFVYGLLEKMYDPRAQNLGKRILNSMKARPAGETDEETHQRLLKEHGEQISQSATALFPNGLDGVSYDGSKPVYDAEDGIMGLNGGERRLLPIAARTRIGPLRSEIVVGTGVSGIGFNIIELILTALNLASGPGFRVHIPKWAMGLLTAASTSLAATSCAVQFYDRKEGLVNATYDPKHVPTALQDLGLNIGVQIPGWLKCALFTGISALVSIITFVVDLTKAHRLLL